MPRGQNRTSILLSRDENEQVFGMIGAKCQSLATAVVQLFTTEGPGHTEWKKKDTGVLCLIKDNSKRSYFFRIYCLYRKTMIWEHEVYLQIEYKSPRPYLHTFEAEEYMTAFNFANEDEAKLLRNILIEKIEQRKQRRQDRRQRAVLAHRANSVGSQVHAPPAQGPALAPRHNGVAPPLPPAPAHDPPQPPKPLPTPNILGGYTVKSSGRKPKGRKITKADIGMPHGFKHVSHVGWDANKGFDVDNLPEEAMRSFFLKAGISETQLQDLDTRKFIYDFINTHGGIDAVKEELHEKSNRVAGPLRTASPAPPPPPATPAPPVPARSPAPHQPPAPPSRAPPPPPARAVPPPPPPPASLAPRNPPPPRPSQPKKRVGKKRISGARTKDRMNGFAAPSAPPPPPPGPPMGAPPVGAPPAPPAPPPPPMPADTAVAPDVRSALMESIRSGEKTLRKVETASRPVVDDSRSNLLSEIRQGKKLKSVSLSQSNSSAERRPAAGGSGLAEALKKALDDRNFAMHSDSDSDASATTSDDDWDV